MAVDVPVLQVEGLTTEFYTEQGTMKVVDGVSFSIRRGETLGLVGESGSGKSTIALSILKLLPNNGRIVGGKILFQGENLVDKGEEEMRRLRGNKISMVFQDPLTSLNPSLTIGEQISEMIVVHLGLEKKKAKEEAIRLLKKVGIPNPSLRMNEYPHQFSGGMQQRVLIAMAISCNRHLVILDEPTTALDVTIEAEIIDLLKQLKEEFDMTILYITHNLGIILRICDRVNVLYSGQVLDQMETRELFEDPLHPYTRGLMASMPRLDFIGRRKRLNNIPGILPNLLDPPRGCLFHPRCPFALHQCTDESQRLIDVGPGRKIRCWRYKEAGQMEWPSQTGKELLSVESRKKEDLIRVEHLSKSYRISNLWSRFTLSFKDRKWPSISFRPSRLRAVNDVSFTIREGETFGLVGESGCGKTTLGRCVLRLLRPTEGRIFFRGKDLADLPTKVLKEYRKYIQVIFQNPDSSLNPRKTIAQIIGRPLEIFGLASGIKKERKISELLEIVHLPESYRDRYPHELSGGEKQRVGIAKALAFNPKFIVCDEPVTALDVSIQATILNLLTDLRERFDLSYLFIAHDLSVIAHVSDRVGVMYLGRFCEVGSVDEVFNPPYHPYTQVLLSAIPIMDYSLSQRPRIRPRSTLDIAWSYTGCPFQNRCPEKVGTICEVEDPPIRRVSDSHFIVCHKPLKELEALKSPLIIKGD